MNGAELFHLSCTRVYSMRTDVRRLNSGDRAIWRKREEEEEIISFISSAKTYLTTDSRDQTHQLSTARTHTHIRTQNKSL